MTHSFHVLGTPEVRRGAALVDVGHARQLSVLAVLLVDVNQVVSVDKLLVRVWGEAPPRQAKSALYSYMSRLRTALDGLPIVRRSGGYVLEADPSSIDLHQFRSLVARGAHGEAVALVRGKPFEGLHGAWFDGLRETLAGEITAAELDHTDSRLAAGEHRTLVAELTARAARRTARRTADACVDRCRPTVRRPGLLLAAATPARGRAGPRPRSRPARPARVAGATSTVESAPAPVGTRGVHRPRSRARGTRTGPIVTITGPAGTGKSWLALHWAHAHAADYPDGIPPEPHTQTALYRTLLADRRMLIVLD